MQPTMDGSMFLGSGTQIVKVLVLDIKVLAASEGSKEVVGAVVSRGGSANGIQGRKDGSENR